MVLVDTIAGTTQTFDALQTALNSAHGSGSWATATGFSTHAAGDVWTVGARSLTDKSGFTISGTNDDAGRSSDCPRFGSWWGSLDDGDWVSARTRRMMFWTVTTRALTDKAGFTIAGTTTTLDALEATLSSSLASLNTLILAIGSQNKRYRWSSPGVEITNAAMQSIADEVLKRDLSNVEDTLTKHTLGGVIVQQMLSTTTVGSNTLTGYKTDTTTVLFTWSFLAEQDVDGIVDSGGSRSWFRDSRTFFDSCGGWLSVESGRQAATIPTVRERVSIQCCRGRASSG